MSIQRRVKRENERALKVFNRLFDKAKSEIEPMIKELRGLPDSMDCIAYPIDPMNHNYGSVSFSYLRYQVLPIIEEYQDKWNTLVLKNSWNPKTSTILRSNALQEKLISYVANIMRMFWMDKTLHLLDWKYGSEVDPKEVQQLYDGELTAEDCAIQIVCAA